MKLPLLGICSQNLFTHLTRASALPGRPGRSGGGGALTPRPVLGLAMAKTLHWGAGTGERWGDAARGEGCIASRLKNRLLARSWEMLALLVMEER